MIAQPVHPVAAVYDRSGAIQYPKHIKSEILQPRRRLWVVS